MQTQPKAPSFGADKTLNVADMIERQQQEKRRIAAVGPKASARQPCEAGTLSKPQQAVVREFLIGELETIRREILSKRRGMQAWAHGYDSALSVINTRIEALRA